MAYATLPTCVNHKRVNLKFALRRHWKFDTRSEQRVNAYTHAQSESIRRWRSKHILKCACLFAITDSALAARLNWLYTCMFVCTILYGPCCSCMYSYTIPAVSSDVFYCMDVHLLLLLSGLVVCNAWPCGEHLRFASWAHKQTWLLLISLKTWGMLVESS